MFERFTDRARRIVVLAQEEAKMLHHDYIGTEYILLGIIHEGEGVGCKVLEELGFSLDDTRERLIARVAPGQVQIMGHIPFTERAKKVLELALREALQLGHNYIGSEHILLALIREGEGVAAQILQESTSIKEVREKVVGVLNRYIDTVVTPSVPDSNDEVEIVLQVALPYVSAVVRDGVLSLDIDLEGFSDGQSVDLKIHKGKKTIARTRISFEN